jgi:hypothetical protein
MILECKQCQALVNAEFVANYKYTYDVEGYFHLPARYDLLKCPNCQNPFLIDSDESSDGYNVLYPPPDNRVNPNLPAPLRLAYSEAMSCYKSKAYTATAIMCRKTLEGICAEHGVTGNNLVKNLKELKDKGIIENRLYEWADALRISGNEAAHDVKVTISLEDARDILEFTHALLEYVFTFRDRFEQFKQRRASNANKPPPSPAP